MNISEHIGVEALLEQTAEECTEMAHACLKMARKLRDENPTPMSIESCSEKLTEETADVMLCINTLMESEVLIDDEIDTVIERKQVRWEDRINKNKLKKHI